MAGCTFFGFIRSGPIKRVIKGFRDYGKVNGVIFKEKAAVQGGNCQGGDGYYQSTCFHQIMVTSRLSAKKVQGI